MPHGRLLVSAAALVLAGLCLRGDDAPMEAQKTRSDRQGDTLPAGARARLGTVRFRNGAGIFTIAFTPDGKMLAVPAGPEQPIRLWDVVTGKEIRSVGKPQTLVESLAFSPNGKVLATKSAATVQLWDVHTGQSIRKCRPRTYY